jgi:uncharacterized protein
MITEAEVRSIELTVLLGGLSIGVLLGWVGRYSRFCTLGAIADLYALGDGSRIRMWLLAIAVAITGTQLLIDSTTIDVSGSIYVMPRLLWLSNILGGLLFGFGMALASGCGSRTLIRLGGGSLKALVVFLVMATSAAITIRGFLGVLRVETLERVAIDLPSSQAIPALINLPPMLVAGALVIGLLVFIFSSNTFRQQPRLWLGGTVVGLLVVAAWWVTGHVGFIPEDPNSLEPRFLATNTRAIESLTFVAPLSYSLDLLSFWSDTSRKLTFGIMTVSGVAIGAWLHAITTRSFRWEGFQNTEDLANHLIGAALMGSGGVIALGCTIGQGISGLSVLGLGSVLATGAIVAGAWLGLTWLSRRA